MASQLAMQESQVSVAISLRFLESAKKTLVKIKKMNQRLQLDLKIDKSSFTLDEWLAELQRVNILKATIPFNRDEKNLLKAYRIDLLRSFYQWLTETTNQPLTPERTSSIEKYQTLRKYLRMAIYSFILPMGLAMHSISSFLGIQKILAFIPAISSPVSLAVSIGLALFNAAVFYTFEAIYLRRSLGIKTKNHHKKDFSSDAKEIEIVKKINTHFRHHADQLTKNTFEKCAELIPQLSAAVMTKKQFYQVERLPEGKLSRFARNIVTGINALTIGTSSYFLATTLLTAIAAPLVGTPVGLAFVLLGVVSSLVFFVAKRSKSAFNLMSPTNVLFHENKIKFNDFDPVTRQECDRMSRLNHELPELQTENLKLKQVAKLEKHVFSKYVHLAHPPKIYSDSLGLFAKNHDIVFVTPPEDSDILAPRASFG